MVNAPETMKPRYISTGRGGGGNFKKASNMAKKQESTTPAIDSQAAEIDTETDLALTRIATHASLGARFATGRGGAGNILPAGQAPLPAQTQPLVTKPRANFSSGRGGAGNFRDAKTGRSLSESSTNESSKKHSIWAGRVPRIGSASDENVGESDLQRVQSNTGSISSTKSASSGFLGRLKRRLSSFSAQEA